ncbi:MAG: cupredoxin family copper-binding protein [Candidatus Eremiobacteraeota bacterium]|nr:cupredoxin family copper-binding protein [Candidatus Eremiobacteraeota bacterium]
MNVASRGRAARGVLVAFLLTAALFCAGAYAARADNAGSTSSSPAATVHIKNFAYSPSPATIKTGETVLFINDDPVPHTVTATEAKTFDSGNMDQNGKWQYTFTKAGTYTYLCTYHTYMKGSVVVKDAQ